jgi:hypothetical protein
VMLLGCVAKARGDRIVLLAEVSARALQQGHSGRIGHEEDSLKPADCWGPLSLVVCGRDEREKSHFEPVLVRLEPGARPAATVAAARFRTG